MKKTSFLIVSLLASTPVYGVSKSTEKTDAFKGSKDRHEEISKFLPSDEAMRLMHSTNKQLKNRLDQRHYLGQTPGGHFHVHHIADRVIAKRIPTTTNNTTAQIDLEQFLRDKNIKARQLDLVSPTLDGT